MTKEKYTEIKSYVLSRLQTVGSFDEDGFRFRGKFDLPHGWYEELQTLAIEDGLPFAGSSSWKDGYGDPDGTFQFSQSPSNARDLPDRED